MRFDRITGQLMKEDSGESTRRNDSILGHYRQNLPEQSGNKQDIQLGRFRSFGSSGIIVPGAQTEVVNLGLLYNHFAVVDERQIVAEGFKIPTQSEMLALRNFCDNVNNSWYSNNAAHPLKHSTMGGTDLYGFSMKRSGYRNNATGEFQDTLSSLWLLNITTINAYYLTFTFGSGNRTLLSSYAERHAGMGLRPIKISTTLNHGEKGTYTQNDGRILETICIDCGSGNKYEIVNCNIAETKYRNGDLIQEITDNSAWLALTTGALCAYNNDWNNVYETIEGEAPTAPTFTGSADLEVEETSFTASIEVNPNGASTRVFLQWGTNQNFPDFETECTGSPLTETGTVSAEVTGITGDIETYYFRFRAQNIAGQSFTLGALLNQNEPEQQQAFLPTGTIVTRNGEMIVMSGENDFVLTVDGFQPLELLMAGGLPAISNEKFISK